MSMATRANANDRDIQLARYIQEIRKQKGYTQEQLADKIGVSLTHYSYLEIGYKLPNTHMLQRIADALEVKVKELIPF
jgi:transcriptional regulator with XRE-family HTH domain